MVKLQDKAFPLSPSGSPSLHVNRCSFVVWFQKISITPPPTRSARERKLNAKRKQAGMGRAEVRHERAKEEGLLLFFRLFEPHFRLAHSRSFTLRARFTLLRASHSLSERKRDCSQSMKLWVSSCTVHRNISSYQFLQKCGQAPSIMFSPKRKSAIKKNQNCFNFIQTALDVLTNMWFTSIFWYEILLCVFFRFEMY